MKRSQSVSKKEILVLQLLTTKRDKRGFGCSPDAVLSAEHSDCAALRVPSYGSLTVAEIVPVMWEIPF